ncbi:MAG: hypothetical protein HON47_03995, partial [Candidatus Diapherotrites archaeon]|nr:hypothetical protein [Candidatus Diapherotrites archaeon]
SILDKINTKVPVYKAVDPIDRVIPSFILFLLIILFIIILVGYLIQFSTPYDVTLITHDSSTKVFLSGVTISGELNGEQFSGKTDSTGEYSFSVEGTSTSFFGMLGGLIFPSELDFSGYINAKASGYEEIKKKQIDFTSTKHKIYLQAIPDEPEYPNSTIVELQDSVSGEAIVSSDNYAYVKFKCNNKNISVKTVRDEADGAKDGKFTLTEDSCHFVATKAYSPGYNLESISKILPTDKSTHPILLTKEAIETQGTAKVYVYDGNTLPKEGIDGIKVVFNGTNGNSYAGTNSSGLAEKKMDVGEYTITITDENYYEITANDNIKITIEAGQPTELEIQLEKINQNDRRRVYFKVIDSTTSVALKDVQVDLLWIYTDSNGNQFGTDATHPLSYHAGNSHTDNNGLFVANDFTLRSEGQLVAILKKDEYIYKIVKPELFTLTNGPQTIQLEKATALNSGFAQINVEAGDSNRPLANAQAYLYTDIIINSVTITGIALEKNGKYTNSSGIANYSDLAVGIENSYFAQAKFSGSSSDFTSKKQVDANQTIYFNIHMNLNISYLEIELIDFDTREQIQNSSQANIEIYTADSEFVNILFSEKLDYSFGFTSAGYLQTQKLLIKTKLTGYVNQTIEINQTMNPGANKIRILMVPTSLATDNVNILFDNIYKSSDFLLDSNSSVEMLLQGGEYAARFLTIIGQDFNYKKAVSFGRVIGSTNITRISAMPLHLEMDAFTCTTTAQDDDLTHDDNYYLPTLSECKTSGANNQQAGFKWEDANLEPGVYNFIVHFSVDGAAADDELISLHYKAKEKHNPETETPLYKLDFYIGQPLNDSLALTAKVNNSSVLFTNGLSPKFSVVPGEENKLKIKVINKRTESVNSGYLKLYSYNGSTTSFDEAVLDPATISFNQTNIQTSLTLEQNLVMGSFNSREYDVNFYSPNAGDTGWIVIVLKADNTTITKFIDIKANARKLILDAEFLGLVNNQIFTGFANPKFSSEAITIEDMTIDVRKNCRNTLAQEESVYFYSGDDIAKSGNYFVRDYIPGVYTNGIDCVIVDILRATGPSGDYEPLTKKIYAGTANAQDPSLACIAVETADGDPENLYLDWDEDGQINIINTCASEAEIKIETGVECAECWDVQGNSSVYSLASGENKIFNVTGKNITYLDSEDFSDILGYFPFTIKAKLLSGGSSRKRYAVADEIGVHIRNSNECFIISKDIFDFLNDGNNIPFDINNECQYEELENYFVPKAHLSSFNINLNSEKPEYAYIDFDWELIASGGSYSISYTTSTKEYYGGMTRVDLEGMDKNIVNSKSTRYIEASADFSSVDGNIDELYLKWQDVDNDDYFGAAIDGKIKVTYKDGNIIEVTPRVNMVPGNETTCVCDDVDYNRSCNSSPNPGQNYCLFGRETLLGIRHLTYGITHNEIPKGEVARVDFNIIGNSDLNNLTFQITPHILLEIKTPVVTPVPGTGDQTFKSGNFKIYPTEGATYILRNIAQDTSSQGLSLEESFCKESNGGKAWELGDYLYWINPSYTTKSIAKNICEQTNDYTNLFGQSGNLITGNESGLITMLTTNIVDFSWLDSNLADGMWTDDCTTSGGTTTCDTIIEQSGSMVKSSDNADEFAMYAPLCKIEKTTTYDLTSTDCASIVSCDTTINPPVCTLGETHSENNFFTDTFIAMTNPKVRFDVTNVSPDSGSLTNGSVMVWIEGKYLKARFLGDDYVGYSDGSIELELENDSSNNIQYSIINIKDYINQGGLKNTGN